MKNTKFKKAWDFLAEHSYFAMEKRNILFCFPSCLDIDVMTDKKGDFIALEAGDWDKEYKCSTHDIKLDCCGRTFEQAIIKLARLVKKHYGVK